MRFLIMLSLFLLPLSAFAQATPAWSLEPSRYEGINQTWSGHDLGGGASYSVSLARALRQFRSSSSSFFSIASA